MLSNNMTTTQKSILALVGVVVLLAIYGAYQYPIVQQLAGAAPQGATYSGVAGQSIVVNLAAPGANATSSSILNTSSNDYYVTAIRAACNGVGTSQTAYTGTGLVALTLTVATTSTAAPATLPTATNKVGNSTLTIATSTGTFVVASSTAVLPGSTLINNIWASGSYMTFTTNATNTAICTFGADYMSE